LAKNLPDTDLCLELKQILGVQCAITQGIVKDVIFDVKEIDDFAEMCSEIIDDLDDMEMSN
jgi:hypothetical protein